MQIKVKPIPKGGKPMDLTFNLTINFNISVLITLTVSTGLWFYVKRLKVTL